jgi:cytochrome c5
VSKQDTHFFNIFSLVIGLLITVTLIIFALSRSVAGRTQEPETYADPLYKAGVEARIKPFVRVAVAGRDNTALVIQGLAQSGTIKLAIPKDGVGLYDAVCKTCHLTGLVGAPKTGNKDDWGSRLAEGKSTLYEHAIKGYTGKTGIMPAKGGRTDLEDDLIKQGVDYLLAQVK